MKLKIEVPPGEYDIDEVRIYLGECFITFNTLPFGQLTFVFGPDDFAKGPAAYTQGSPEIARIETGQLKLFLDKTHFDLLQAWLEPHFSGSLL